MSSVLEAGSHSCILQSIQSPWTQLTAIEPDSASERKRASIDFLIPLHRAPADNTLLSAELQCSVARPSIMLSLLRRT